jgi:hypothetical protein
MSEVLGTLGDPLLIIALGIAGGGLAELVKWYKIRDSTNMDEYKKPSIYWVLTVLMILAGGVLAFAYSKIGDINALLAINVGASAPLIIGGLANSPAPQPKPPAITPSITIGAATDEPKPKQATVKDFLSWR